MTDAAAPERTAETVCPDCSGAQTIMAIVDGHNPDGTPFGGIRRVNCITCRGTGAVDHEHRARVAKGKAMRDARVAKGQSLFEAAKERDISPAELSAIEHGRASERTK